MRRPKSSPRPRAGYPTEEIPKFVAKENWNTLYPDKKLTLEKKSPVDRIARRPRPRRRSFPDRRRPSHAPLSRAPRRPQDLAPPGFKTYKNTYPGLFGFPEPPKKAAAPKPAPKPAPAA